MEFFKVKTHIDFMGKRKYALILSGALALLAVVSLAIRGLNFGIDFTGGTLVEARYPQPVELSVVRSALYEAGFQDAQVQHFGTAHEVLVRLAPRKGVSAAELSERILRALKASDPEVEMRRVEFVGPQVGEELAEDGGLAMLCALIGILIYVSVRFEYRFAVGSIIALIHDVFITVGVFSLFQIEFDLTVFAALLAVIGYSLNDTIVIFDRIRENFRKLRKGTPLEIANVSINETLSRTLMTGVTALMVLFALYFLGGKVLHNFSLALIIGVVVGTYSSIYVASAYALLLGISKADLMPAKKEGAEFDSRP
jgi:protein-export membrane protein, SecD/SecF family